MRQFRHFSFLAILLSSAHCQQEADDVAMIIGGVSYCSTAEGCEFREESRQSQCENLEPGLEQLNSVEIFGCPEGSGVPEMPPFPSEITFASGLWLPTEKKVLVCGGLDCFSLQAMGKAKAQCYFWDPWGDSKVWQPADTMRLPRAAHILGTIPDASGVRRAFAIGGYTPEGNYTTEILRDAGWEMYTQLPAGFEPHDNAYGCMIQVGELVYSVRNRVTQLQLRTWVATDMGATPTPQLPRGNVGQCAQTAVNNSMGILVRKGNFFDLQRRQWTHVTSPNLHRLAEAYSMATFRGRATIFGLVVCDHPEDGPCRTGTEVIQLNPSGTEWISLGHMREERLWHEIIAMPKEVCMTFTEVTTTEESGGSTTTTAATTTTTSAAAGVTVSSLLSLSIILLRFYIVYK